MDLKDYIDQRFKDFKDYIDSNLYLDRKAVDQYSKTNDEWKGLHNGLQRKMEEDKNNFVTKDMLDKQSQLVFTKVSILIAVISLAILIYVTFK